MTFYPTHDAAFPEEIIYGHIAKEYPDLFKYWIYQNPDNRMDQTRLLAMILNLRQIMRENIAGDFAECGVYRGHTAKIIDYYAELSGKTLHLFDTFTGFPIREQNAINEQSRKTLFTDTSISYVQAFVGPHNYRRLYYAGDFMGHSHKTIKSRYSFVHIDFDTYKPTYHALRLFYPLMASHGIIMVHDYLNPSWPDVRKAVDKFLQIIPESLVILPDRSGTAVIRVC